MNKINIARAWVPLVLCIAIILIAVVLAATSISSDSSQSTGSSIEVDKSGAYYPPPTNDSRSPVEPINIPPSPPAESLPSYEIVPVPPVEKPPFCPEYPHVLMPTAICQPDPCYPNPMTQVVCLDRN